MRVLVTSRESLGLEGERVFALRPLAVPSAAWVNLDAVKSSEAVRLFVNRAQTADREFVLDADSAPPVVEICRRLDGIPLAIELAAARVKMLSVEEIRSRLDNRFRLLTGGHKALRTAPDAAGRIPMELRPAHGGRAAPVPIAGGLRGWLDVGSCDGCMERYS